jgi:hypothetical protein
MYWEWEIVHQVSKDQDCYRGPCVNQYDAILDNSSMVLQHNCAHELYERYTLEIHNSLFLLCCLQFVRNHLIEKEIKR